MADRDVLTVEPGSCVRTSERPAVGRVTPGRAAVTDGVDLRGRRSPESRAPAATAAAAAPVAARGSGRRLLGAGEERHLGDAGHRRETGGRPERPGAAAALATAGDDGAQARLVGQTGVQAGRWRRACRGGSSGVPSGEWDRDAEAAASAREQVLFTVPTEQPRAAGDVVLGVVEVVAAARPSRARGGSAPSSSCLRSTRCSAPSRPPGTPSPVERRSGPCGPACDAATRRRSRATSARRT